jgi:hypothetical protein
MNFINENNSCFLDSLLVSMFTYSGSPFIKLVKSVKYSDLSNSIKETFNSNSTSSRKIRNNLPVNLRRGQHDPGETYLYIMRELGNYEPMKLTNIRQVKKPGSDKIYKKKSNNESSSCFTVENSGEDTSFAKIINPDWETLSRENMIHDKSNTPVYNQTRNLIFFTEAESLIFYFNRCRNVTNKYKNRLDMPILFDAGLDSNTLTQRTFFCYAIIVHIGDYSAGGHYITVIFEPDTESFYIYDDMVSNVQPMQWTHENKEFVERNGIMYFYYEKSN